jgi:protein phosphatase 1G
MGANLVYLDRP